VETFWDRDTCMDSMKVEKADQRRVWTIWALGAKRWTYIYTY
jgi:hypothetical protein